MKPIRFLLWACAAASLSVATAGRAQSWPEKSIRLIVPWPVGGASDSVGRQLAQALSTELGKSVVVENIGGAGGNIGTQAFVRAAPDGHTLYLATSSTNAANPHLYAKLGFEPVKDFTPVVLVTSIPSVLVVPNASPYANTQALIAAAKEQPGKLAYASGGVGASAHLAGELFKSVTKIDTLHVPYKGSGPAMTDVMGGQVTYMFDTGAFPYLKGGKVRALGVAADRRTPLLPDVPTFDELGIQGMHMGAWYGLAAPAGTPSAIVERINAATNHALKSGDLAQKLAALGGDARGGSVAQFSAFWKSELDRYGVIVKASGAKLE